MNDKKDDKKPAEDTSVINTPSHYIGIGASAGGLEAIQQFLDSMPADTGAAFVIVQHLSPDFKSMMLELLSKHTDMSIYNVEQDMRVAPNSIYLIPPKKTMIIKKGHLELMDKPQNSGLTLPIDIFFCSLAKDMQHKAIGIILSGTGSDGSQGIRALKEQDALIIAQEPDSAKFDGMPNSAIKTGTVDLILNPEEMGSKIASYMNHPLRSQKPPAPESVNSTIDDIFLLLNERSNNDFSKYKPSTVARRIERRIAIRHVDTIKDYLSLLYKDVNELDQLNNELLIGVTQFFRDKKAFEELRDKIIPDIIKTSSNHRPIRVWIAGCSTGEEAYSLAIMLHEEINRQSLKRQIKVFATDVNPISIGKASTGIYGSDIVNQISKDYLYKYFHEVNSGSSYQIRKNIRQMVIFATHNMISDPPFSNMDLVTCRNVLIYFQQSVQQQVLISLHFSLKKSGYLFLGSSENLADLKSQFTTVNDRFKIYQKNSNQRIPFVGSRPDVSQLKDAGASVPSISRLMRSYQGRKSPTNVISFANDILLKRYAPPSILLNDEHEALHVYGDVSELIKRMEPGRISIDIKDMINESLSIAVDSALQRAKQKSEEVYYTDITIDSGDTTIGINLRASYFKEHDMEGSPGYFWLTFENSHDNEQQSLRNGTSFDIGKQAKERIEDLEMELKRNREHLQITVEELETTNEELQSANEELMTANEEMQSTNEELQSVNEELYTVNSEFQEKISEISQANGDLDEVLNLSKIGIIFLDENLVIRRFTHMATQYVNLMESDIDRPFHHISKKIEYESMLNDVTEVCETCQPKEVEILLKNQQVLKVSINPYDYNDVSQTQGVAITFSDVSTTRYTETGMRVAYKQLKNSINNALELLDEKAPDTPIHVLVVDDSQSDIELVKKQLLAIEERKVEVSCAECISDAIDILKKGEITICLMDYYLRHETAIDFMFKIQEHKIDLPVVVITGDKQESMNPMLLSHGVLDLINKDDITKPLLHKTIQYAIRRKEIDQQISEHLSVDE